MKIGIFHGYELTGSGSNEYTLYLSRSLLLFGLELHVICREPDPFALDFVNSAIKWDQNGNSQMLFERNTKFKSKCVLHQMPVPPINAVYLTDKQRSGNIKSFTDLTDQELKTYHEFTVNTLRPILLQNTVDILHTNHLIYQPVAALQVCKETGIPFIIYPHGSSIEYVIRKDNRYKELALKAIIGAKGLIIGNEEVRERIIGIYPEYEELIRHKTEIVGVGVDTSLFSPVLKKNRLQSINKLIGMEPFEGKDPEITVGLFRELEKNDIYATTSFRNSYNNDLPDRDLVSHLKKIPWDRDILIFVGALTVGKGLQSIIAAFPSILKKHPHLHIVIIGSGAYREVLEGFVYAISKGNEQLIDKFIEHGYDLDLNALVGPWEDVKYFLSDNINRKELLGYGSALLDHVHFLGRMDHSLLKYIFPCADFSIFPSTVPEAYPLVLMESLSNGVFPIMSYFSGFKDAIDSLDDYLNKDILQLMKISMDPEKRIKSIIRCVSGALEYPGLNSVSPKLRSIAVKNFDWKIRARQMINAYLKRLNPGIL